MKFRKKPVVIEAVQWTGERTPELIALVKAGAIEYVPSGKLCILTLEGEMTADRGDWIIKGVKGELYPCKPDIFAATYEAVES